MSSILLLQLLLSISMPKLVELIGQALSTDEKVIFKKYLRALTKNLIDGVVRFDRTLKNSIS